MCNYYKKKWNQNEGKITLGISAYGFTVSARDVQKTGIILKQKLKNSSSSLRLIPNHRSQRLIPPPHTTTNWAWLPIKLSYLLFVPKTDELSSPKAPVRKTSPRLARRDQGRPKRDAFVGMLPPKLAQIMVNLASPSKQKPRTANSAPTPRPFLRHRCYPSRSRPYGLRRLRHRPCRKDGRLLQSKPRVARLTYTISISMRLFTTVTPWKPPGNHPSTPSSAKATSVSHSAPRPSPQNSLQVRQKLQPHHQHILKEPRAQINPALRFVSPFPPGKIATAHFTHLPLITNLSKLGYTRHSLQTISSLKTSFTIEKTKSSPASFSY